jgi:hypothetical protein
MNLFVSYQYNAVRGDVTIAGYGNIVITDCPPIKDGFGVDFMRGSIIRAAKDEMGVDSLNPTILFFRELEE